LHGGQPNLAIGFERRLVLHLLAHHSDRDSAKNMLEGANMKRSVLCFLAILALASCSGGGSVPGTIPATVADTSASAQPATITPQSLTPYEIPVVDDPTVDGAQRSSGPDRNTLDSWGGIPSQALLTDATNLPPGSQANFAIVSVNAVAGNVTYPIVQYLFPQVINVLNFQSSALLLGTGFIPAIQYTGVQYVVDPALSSIVIGSHHYPMSFGSMANSTFTPMPGGNAALYFPAPVNAAKVAPNFLVDFNAATWVTISGNTAEVSPSGSGTVLSESAVIQGTILNKAGGPVSGAVVSAYGPDGVIVNSAPSDSKGVFQIHAISGNGYSLVVWNTYAPVNSVITNQATGNDPLGWSISGGFVQVPAGNLVNIGTIKD
jgi:hypothetical protein